jgi:predicted MFS family arabinose efflux permease
MLQMTKPNRQLKIVGTVALLGSVAMSFADSSVVVLALPDLLKQFAVSIEQVAWVVTAYNVALAAAAFAVGRTAFRSMGAARLARTGGVIFLASSALCAVSPSVWILVVSRSVQGVGAGLLLVGALPLMRALAATPERGTALWVGAGVFGSALGPAAGGLLTEGFSWPAIFYAQVPVAAFGLVAAMKTSSEPPEPNIRRVHVRKRRIVQSLALASASAALVGLLFLVVVELIDVWRLSPLRAAGVISVLPLAALLAQPWSRAGGSARVVAGAVLIAGGLVGMALVPARSLGWVVAAVAMSGLGLGLLLAKLTARVLAGDGTDVGRAAETIWIRHIGLVVGLLVITPLLAADLSAAGNSAKLRGVSVVLDAPVPVSTKLRLAVTLAPVIAEPAQGGLPDLSKAVSATHDRSLTMVGTELDRVVTASITRGFRRAFLVAALFGILAVCSALASRRRWSIRATLAPSMAVIATGALVGSEAARGGISFGTKPHLLPPCSQHHLQASGGETQQFLLGGLDVISCRLHKGREQTLVDLAKNDVGVNLLTALAGRK